MIADMRFWFPARPRNEVSEAWPDDLAFTRMIQMPPGIPWSAFAEKHRSPVRQH
jgi:hypothetical protein